ncbi:MAG: redox-regulated ATPase YchF [Phycisphaeraceae bacterium]|nr:redox-regulated ATPase YchF [Phycisphaeraceae bacterium]
MEAGIVGLPYVGKTALFNALAAGHAPAESQSGGVKPHVSIVPVPDPRLATINRFVETQKIVPASLRLVDVPGLAPGAGTAGKFLSHVRNVDALVHVVRCFEDPSVPHVKDTVDPARDCDHLETELILADLEQVEGMADKARRDARMGDKDAKLRLELVEAAVAALSDEKPLRTIMDQPPFNNPDARRLLRSIAMLTAKPVLFVANVAEDDPRGESKLVQKLRNKVGPDAIVIPVCAKLEAELAELPDEEREPMLKELGLSEPAIAVLARAAYQLLGLQSFYTAGPKEIKAWTIPQGATAPQAAGAIHSDFERGFIRVEVYSVADLEQHKTEQAIKTAGKMRVEGKNYIVHDSDICHFLFNV